MATTDILPFAEAGGANVMPQADYAALGARTAGFLAGLASSAAFNKVWRQSSFMAAGLAGFCVDQGISVPDDGNVPGLVSEIEAALLAYIHSLGIGTGVTTISASRALTKADAGLVLLDCTGGNLALTLPAANVLGAGHSLPFLFRRIDTSGNMPVFTIPGGDNVDGTTGTYSTVRPSFNFNSDGVHTWKRFPRHERLRLAADLTIFVGNSGSNTANSGLTGAQPFQTLQFAADWALNNVDAAGFAVNIRLLSGTYAGASISRRLVGGGALNIIGNGAARGDVTIAGTSGARALDISNGAVVDVSHLTLTSDTGAGLASQTGAYCTVHDVDFATAGQAQIFADAGGVNITGNYGITGPADCHFLSTQHGLISAALVAPVTITLVSTPAYVAFAKADDSEIWSGAMTFSGSATGKRYDGNNNAVIATNGGGASFYPGNASGTVATGAQYT